MQVIALLLPRQTAGVPLGLNSEQKEAHEGMSGRGPPDRGLSWLQNAPPNLRVREDSKVLMMAALGAVLDTLDEAARSN